MTDPRITLDDLCGVEGHPAVRHECWQVDKALGIRKCPIRTDEWGVVWHSAQRGERVEPLKRCGATLSPYEQHEFILVCERGHVIHPTEVDNAGREDEQDRVRARMEEARREAADASALAALASHRPRRPMAMPSSAHRWTWRSIWELARFRAAPPA